MDTPVTAITGAAGVLGRAVCATLRAAGHQVVTIDLGGATSGTGADTPMYALDLTNERDTQTVFKAIEHSMGRLTGLANIAGGFRWETVAEGDPATWELLWNLNVKTALHACRAALPILAHSGGSIVNVSAAATARADAGMGAYTATKSAVSRMTEALAMEWKDKGVRVNAVLPSIIDTPANRLAMPEADISRWVAPSSLAKVIAFLLSDQAAAVTGALLPVTGRV